MAKKVGKFDHRLQNLESHIIAFLASIDEVRGMFRFGLRLTPQAITNLKKSVLVTSAGASTRIEGSKLSDDEVKKILQGLSVSSFADRDSQEVQGYLETLENVFDSYEKLALRESTIISLHKELLKYSTKDDLHRGEYKHKENVVGVLGKDGNVATILFETSPAYLTPGHMTELVEWTHTAFEKERFHPLLIIANFIIEFLKIHPFEDGNGRLSRVMTNLLLLQSQYQFVQYVSHEQLIEKRKDEYYFALRTSQKTFGTKKETIVPWLNFFLSIIKEQANRAVILIEQNQENDLSPHQRTVLEYLSTVGEVSPKVIAKNTGINWETVRKSLQRLMQLNKVKRTGRGPGTRYEKV